MVERQTPNLMVGGSNPSWPAKNESMSEKNFLENRLWMDYERYCAVLKSSTR